MSSVCYFQEYTKRCENHFFLFDLDLFFFNSSIIAILSHNIIIVIIIINVIIIIIITVFNDTVGVELFEVVSL